MVGYDGEARRDLLGRRSGSSSMFPLLDRIGISIRRAGRASPSVVLRALGNALVTFCVAVFLGVLFVRSRGRLGAGFRAFVRSLLGLLGVGPRKTSSDRVRALAAGAPASWRGAQAGMGTAACAHGWSDPGRALTGEPADAVSRVVDLLYAEYFAGGSPVEHGDLEDELGVINRWARGRRRARITNAPRENPGGDSEPGLPA